MQLQKSFCAVLIVIEYFQEFAKKQSFTNYMSVFRFSLQPVAQISHAHVSGLQWLLTPYFLLPLVGNTLPLSDMHLSFDLTLTSCRSGASRLPAPESRSGPSVPVSSGRGQVLSAGLNFSGPVSLWKILVSICLDTA